tara:strand:- start:26154 stop:26315 length:162 start_codon:yes stop_codon:yes gene_type:complete
VPAGLPTPPRFAEDVAFQNSLFPFSLPGESTLERLPQKTGDAQGTPRTSGLKE